MDDSMFLFGREAQKAVVDELAELHKAARTARMEAIPIADFLASSTELAQAEGLIRGYIQGLAAVIGQTLANELDQLAMRQMEEGDGPLGWL